MSMLPDIQGVIGIATRAGLEELRFYRNKEMDISLKEDRSPLTEADLAGHAIITRGLSELTPHIPILSEEAPNIPYETRRRWNTYWLVDPLDGTKEFIKKNDDFTVNIALMAQGEPILGVIHAPAQKQTYLATKGRGAFRIMQGGEMEPIRVEPKSGKPIRILASRSHHETKIESFLNHLEDYEIIRIGSSLKFCRIAEGTAHLYIRFGPTMEWDTAAGQCIVMEAGGHVKKLNGQPLTYNKPDLRNPNFMVSGAPTSTWKKYLDSL